MQAVPGTISDEAKRLRFQRLKDIEIPGCGSARAYVAFCSDASVLKAIVSQDQQGDGKPLWHLSVSHSDKNGVPDRCPTWDEIKRAKYELVPVDVPMMLIFPKRSVKVYVNIHDTCLHLWEAEAGIDE